ncbi:MAG: hypothetical protein ABIZ91_07330 [Gemmatimonadaceae bacterium]
MGAPSSTTGVGDAGHWRRRAFRLAIACLAPLAAAPAQVRLVQSHRASEPEGRLLAFYSAAMVFSPLGASAGLTRWWVGLEATYLPALSETQRRPGIDKPETSNLSPVLPRPRVMIRTPAGVIEGSWVPPVRVVDARAHLLALAYTPGTVEWRGIAFAPRVSGVAGRVQGAITCNRQTAASGGQDLAVYYATVCHGRESDDWFEPRLAALEVVASRRLGPVGGMTYLAAGARMDRSRFDIGVMQDDGSRDPDHPILQLRDARPHVAAGLRWPLGARLATAAEWFYAPGSVSTIRTSLVFGARTRR